jgi:hypothetical protein
MRYLIIPFLVLAVGCQESRIARAKRLIPGATNIQRIGEYTYEFDYKGKRILWVHMDAGGLVSLGDSNSIQANEVDARYYELKKELEELEDKRGNTPKTDQLP